MEASLPQYLFGKLTLGYSDNVSVDRASFPIDVGVTSVGTTAGHVSAYRQVRFLLERYLLWL